MTLPNGGSCTIGTNVFQSNNLTTVHLPSSITELGTSVFNSNNISTITVETPGTISLTSSAFNTNSLVSIDLTMFAHVGDYAFGSNLLETLFLPASVTYGTGAFSSNAALTSVVVEEGVTALATNMFSFCSALNSIVFPSSLNEIPSGIAQNTPLADITIGANVTIPDSSLGNYWSYFNVTYNGNGKLAGRYTRSDTTWTKVA